MTRTPFALLALASVASCNSPDRPTTTETGMADSGSAPGTAATAAAPSPRRITGRDVGAAPNLPQPNATRSGTKFANVVGWSGAEKPWVPDGFTVTLFADSLDNPRWLYVLSNGDVLVAESRTEPPKTLPAAVRKSLVKAGTFGPSANRISRLRDRDGDGRAELRETVLKGLKQPFGMVAVGSSLYVGQTDALTRYPFDSAQGRVTGGGKKILDLPAGGYNNHWTRNVIANPDRSKLYVSVGSGTNVDQEKVDRKDQRRAAILELNPDGSGMRVFASGLRNPNGMDWEPSTGTLWTAVNERDELGDELVPDYITSVRQGAFYGWPFAYWGPHEDPRVKGQAPDKVKQAVAPDFATGAHTATLGLTFGDGLKFPERYRQGAFIGQHGSWNRSQLTGYRVAFVPFTDGRPSGGMEEFVGGFIADSAAGTVRGRPVGVVVARDGSLLVADDAGNRVWRISASR